jgi:hypothetical protein
MVVLQDATPDNIDCMSGRSMGRPSLHYGCNSSLFSGPSWRESDQDEPIHGYDILKQNLRL